jgi:hypothetical protein
MMVYPKDFFEQQDPTPSWDCALIWEKTGITIAKFKTFFKLFLLVNYYSFMFAS